jgi:hypothetical protein
MPTSMEMVLATFQFLKAAKLMANPRTKPSRCKPTNAKNKSSPELKMISFPWLTMLATIKQIKSTAVGGA